jgi:hypothetical protein
VTLTADDVEMLETLLRKGKSAARKQMRAQILLKAASRCPDHDGVGGVGATMVGHTRQRCVEDGVNAALQDRPRPRKAPKLTDKQCAQVIATACTPVPAEHDHRTLRLLADQVVQLGYANSFSHESIHRLLKNTLKPWQLQVGCISKVGAECVAPMEDVLHLYAEADDPARTVVCFDESLKQLNRPGFLGGSNRWEVPSVLHPPEGVISCDRIVVVLVGSPGRQALDRRGVGEGGV